MLNDFNCSCPIYIACGYTDLRRGIDGLASMVSTQFQMDPFQTALFLFCGRRRDRIKALYWEGDGFLLLYKRLENGSFQWPRTKEEVRALSNSELAEKLVTQKVKHNKDGTVTIGLKQYQQATALVNETKKILESEVYSPAELKEMQIATKALQDEKSRYREVTENVMEQIDRKAVEMAQLQERSQQHQIEKLERELSKERYDKNYICEMIKKFLPEALLERFERFSGIVLQRREQEIQRIR